MAESHCVIAAEHPVFAGHFPGKPLVPGVMLLDQVMRLVEQSQTDSEVCEVTDARFLRPVLPGQAFAVHWSRDAESVRFRCDSDGQEVARGRLRLMPRCPT